MSSAPLNLIILGRSGSGKGTQAHLLVKEFDLEYLGTGDLLRKYAERNNALARKLKEMLAQGKLAPSWMPFFVWMEKLAYTDSQKGVLFDGSPRKFGEAKTLDEVLAWFERNNVKAILIDVPRKVAEERLMNRRVCAKCGKGVYVKSGQEIKRCQYCGGDLTIRAEDNPRGIKERLEWFDNEVAKVVEHYRAQNKLIMVDGTKNPFEVHKEILEKLQ